MLCMCGLGCALIGYVELIVFMFACKLIVLFVFSLLSIAVVPCDSTQSSTAPQPHPPTLPGELCCVYMCYCCWL